MEKLTLKFRRIEVTRVDTRGNVLEMLFFYDENGAGKSYRKSHPMVEDVDTFVNRLIHEVKARAYEQNAVMVDDNDFLSYHLNVLIDEKEPGVTKDKIANAIRRFKDKVRSFRSMKSSEGYMTHYHELIGLKASID